MISTREFKRQIGKPLGREMRKLGFKGSGFIYKKEDPDFLYVVFVASGRWGEYCTLHLFIHPKQITKNSVGKLNLVKLPLNHYEFRASLFDTANGKSWEFKDVEFDNLVSLAEIFTVIKAKALPIIERFGQQPGPLDKFKVSDLDRIDLSCLKYIGTTVFTTDIRFAWSLAMVFEYKNPEKASQFAEYGLARTEPNDGFFGRSDFVRIAGLK